MEFTINIGGVEKTVTVEKNADGHTVTVEGQPYQVAGVTAEPGLLSYFLNRRSQVARVSKGAGGMHISLDGERYHFKQGRDESDTPGAGHHGGGDGRLEAPMPGNIVAVKVSVGDEVAAGDPVVVLESMKMQNEITSPVSGIVKGVHCEAGKQVGFGDVLVEVEAAP